MSRPAPDRNRAGGRSGNGAGPRDRDQQVPRQDVGSRMRALLDRAARQDADEAREAWLAEAVEHLVPDEARVLEVLARHRPGSAGRPLLHLHCVTATGLSGEALLENVTDVAAHTSLALPELVPSYVAQLARLDLVTIGPEDERLADDYPALLAAPPVLLAITQARAAGLTPRVMRHSLHLSPLGRTLWDAASAPAQA